VRKWLVELADGLIAHRRPDGQGGYALRAAIRFETDEDQPIAGAERTWPLLWAAYRWTGDRKYLAPMLEAGVRGLPGIAANALDLLTLRESLGPEILSAAETSSDPSLRYLAWQVSGDRRWLETLYEDQIQAAAVREYINTQGSVWTDRASINHAELQRARLGGVALTRNAYVPGQAVSWTFAGDGGHDVRELVGHHVERARERRELPVAVPVEHRVREGVPEGVRELEGARHEVGHAAHRQVVAVDAPTAVALEVVVIGPPGVDVGVHDGAVRPVVVGVGVNVVTEGIAVVVRAWGGGRRRRNDGRAVKRSVVRLVSFWHLVVDVDQCRGTDGAPWGRRH